MDILISGASGLAGTALSEALTARGDSVYSLVRSLNEESDTAIYWNIKDQQIDKSRLEGFDAAIHLAGKNIAGIWTPKFKRELRDSRVYGTKLLTETFAGLKNPPSVFLSASAVGFYGDTGTVAVDEDSPAPAEGFLPILACEWEGAVSEAFKKKSRVCVMRLGVVLSKEGGALKKMLLPFKLGLGGRVGDGKQYFSWVSIEDVVGAFLFCLDTASVEGPVNVVSPNPVTNSEFTKALGNVLKRPTIIPLPAFVVKVVLGEMGENLLLASTRVKPTKLLAAGYTFRHKKVDEALQAELSG